MHTLMNVCRIYLRQTQKPLELSLEDDQLLKDWQDFLSGRKPQARSYNLIGVGSVTIDLREITAIITTLKS